MNERIKLLAEQAGLRFTQLMSNPMVPVVDGKEIDLEKFAQLIVAECASRVTSKADRWGNMTDEIINECILECATDLKQHFGVEE